jgi:hypothetical protein
MLNLRPFRRLLKTGLIVVGGLLLLAGLWAWIGWRYYPWLEDLPAVQVVEDEPLLWVFDEKAVGKPGPKEIQRSMAEPVCGVTSKKHLSPRGDARDYVSLSIYWWPNGLTHLPYLPRDGLRNPELQQYDAPVLQRMIRTVRVLAAAQTAEADARAVQWLTHWFMTEETSMLPHLTFAQMMPGLAAGGRQGIIEGVPLCTDLLDALAWLEQRGALSKELRRALRQWLARYLAWLMQSSPGKAEAVRDNNHATWHAVQVAAIARALGLKDLCVNTLDRLPALAGRQFLPDGQQPHELRRSKSFAYSVYHLQAWLRLERIAQAEQKTFWLSGPAKAFQYLREHVQSWPHQNLTGKPELSELEALLRQGRRWSVQGF